MYQDAILESNNLNQAHSVTVYNIFENKIVISVKIISQSKKRNGVENSIKLEKCFGNSSQPLK